VRARGSPGPKTRASIRGPVAALAISPDGKRLAVGGKSDVVDVWSLPSLEKIAQFSGVVDTRALAFSHDGATLALGGRESAIRLWNVATDKLIDQIESGHRYLMALAYAPDGRTLAAAGGKGIELWDVGAKSRVTTLTSQTDVTQSLQFSADGR